MKKLSVTFLSLFLSNLAFAYDFVVDGIYYYITSYSELTCAVTYEKKGYFGYSSPYSGEIIIPESVLYENKTYSVTKIGDYAFNHCDGLTSVNIPNSVTTIGEYAFKNCYSLTSVTIPNSVTEIGSDAFYKCSGLTSVTIPNSVAEIGYSAFSYCSGLTSVTIPNSVTTIGSDAFYKCSKLSTINIEDISWWIKLLDKRKNYIFENSYSLYVKGLKLTDLVIPQEFTSVPSYCFYKCTGIESITFRENVKTIVQNAFNGCWNVKKINCQSITPPSCGANALTGISRSECTLNVPEESTAYQTTWPWSEFENIVGGKVETPDEPETCAAPDIVLVAGRVIAMSETENSKCYTTITPEDNITYIGNEPIKLSGVYKITSYAFAEGYMNSETVTKMLYWSKPSLDGEAEMTLVGDVNNDGNVDINDVVTLVSVILNQ